MCFVNMSLADSCCASISRSTTPSKLNADHIGINHANLIHHRGHKPQIGAPHHFTFHGTSSDVGRSNNINYTIAHAAHQGTINSLAHSTTHQQEINLKTKINRERKEASDLCSRPDT